MFFEGIIGRKLLVLFGVIERMFRMVLEMIRRGIRF